MRRLATMAVVTVLAVGGLSGCKSGQTTCKLGSMQCTVKLKGKGAESGTEHITFGPRSKTNAPRTTKKPTKGSKKDEDRIHLYEAKLGGEARLYATGPSGRMYNFTCAQGEAVRVDTHTVTCTKVAEDEVELLVD